MVFIHPWHIPNGWQANPLEQRFCTGRGLGGQNNNINGNVFNTPHCSMSTVSFKTIKVSNRGCISNT